MSSPMGPQQAKKSEWAKFFASFAYAFNGLWYVLRTQRNARVHGVIAMLAILMGIVLRISPVEFAMIFVAITGVFIAEMFNTVVELGIDLASPEYDPGDRIRIDTRTGQYVERVK